MTAAHGRAYFHATDDGFMPTGAATSPWDPAHLSGVALGGLLAHLVDRAQTEMPMTVARLTIDILGTAPNAELTAAVRVLREGTRLRMIEAELRADGRTVARATALLTRIADTAVKLTPLSVPLPEDVAVSAPSGRPELRDAIERRIVYGDYRSSGPGAMWVRFAIDMVAGVPMSPLVRAAMLGDMGSAIGSSFPVRDWTFPNVDIAIHFVRPPAGEWVLIEALTESAGNGLAIVSSSFCDRDGVYARGHQALFVSPRGE